MSPKHLQIIEDAYTVLADYRAEWAGRNTAKGQMLLCELRDAICEATGRRPQDVQDDYGTRRFAQVTQ